MKEKSSKYIIEQCKKMLNDDKEIRGVSYLLSVANKPNPSDGIIENLVAQND